MMGRYADVRGRYGIYPMPTGKWRRHSVTYRARVPRQTDAYQYGHALLDLIAADLRELGLALPALRAVRPSPERFVNLCLEVVPMPPNAPTPRPASASSRAPRPMFSERKLRNA